MVSSANEDGNGGRPSDGIEPTTVPLLAPKPRDDAIIEPTTVPLLAPKPRDDAIRIDIPPLQARLLHRSSSSSGRVADFLTPRRWLVAPFSMFRRAVGRREEASLSVPSPAGVPRRLPMRFLRRINWVSLGRACKEWMKNPMNVALLLWLVCVACFLSLLFLLLTELVDGAFPSKASRNHWIEICNQVLNALFTLMSLYQHPKLFHHLVLLCRWRSEDIVELRKVYCKNGGYCPHEWAHMTVVVLLLNITCFAQYILCGLYWGYRSSERPELAEDFFIILGVGAPVLAGVYTVYSPLGREYGSDASDGESHGEGIDPRKEAWLGSKLREQRVAVNQPEWSGGLFDLGDDVPVALLSFFCTCCVFGWNMGRLGFGNMYVHIATFVLLFIAPYWIFSTSAHRIHDDVIRHAVRITGLVLSLLCFLYGGFWRIQIRKRFKLPASTFCCGRGSLTDYAQWMFCWACSLAQEVRTGNFYDVEEDSLYRKHHGGGGGDEGGQPISPPLPLDCDGGEITVTESDSGSQVPTSRLPSLPSPGRVEEESRSTGDQLPTVDEGPCSRAGRDDTMMPPSPVLILVEDRDCDHGGGGGDGLNSPKMEDALLTPETHTVTYTET